MKRAYLVVAAVLLAHLCSTKGSQEEATSSKCPAKCTTYGTCNEELGRCDCPKHMDGPDCSTPASRRTLRIRCDRQLYPDVNACLRPSDGSGGPDAGPTCLNDCNKRGACISGWCHCKPGYYGADCSLSINPSTGKPQLLAGTTYKTREKRPWIYVYELPPNLTTWQNLKRLDRPTHNLFWQRLLSSGARVADPEQADWFFIPVRQRGMSDKELLGDAVDYIRSKWPYWDKYGGGRHFAIHTGDLGMMEAGHRTRNLTSKMTWLTHWGLTEYHKYSDWEAAHVPGKDVVIPVFVSFGHFRKFGMHMSPLHYNFTYKRPRDQTFFFAGRICGDRKPPDTSKPWPKNCGPPDGYSAGVRQAVHHFHHNRPGWKVAVYEPRYDLALTYTKFCLAPLGGGHGQRQIIVSFMGCIPVTIGDNVLQPFEPELDWTKFGLQPLESQVPELHKIIEAIDDKKLKEMQSALRCAAQHMVWSSITGGFMGESGKYDAFETTLEILRVKLAHPEAKPQDYVKVDDDFRRFMACGAEQLGDEIPKEASKPTLCSHSVLEGRKESTCYECLRGSSPSHGIPGGAICCSTGKDLSKCPRVWE